MEYFPAALEKLVEQFARAPGIGGKSAQRLAFHVLSLTDAEAQEFADAIVEAKKKGDVLPHLPQPDGRGALPHLRLAQARRARDLRGGGRPRCGGPLSARASTAGATMCSTASSHR